MNGLWRCRRLTLRNYRAYRGTVTLDLPESGVYRVSGPSGVGKSALLSAIPYLLGYGKSPTSKSVSWGEKAVEVEGRFEHRDGRSFTVARGSSGFKVVVEGETLTSKAAEERLQKLLGVSVDLMETLTRRRQGVPGTFVSMENGDRAELLAQLLGVVEYEDRIDKLGRQVQEVESWVRSRTERVREVERAVAQVPTVDFDEIQERLNAARDLEVRAAAYRDRVSAELATSERDVATRNSEVDEKLRRAAEVRTTLVAGDEARATAVRATWQQVRKELDALHQERNRVASQIGERRRLSEELQAVMRGVCVTCGAPRADDATSSLRRRIDELPDDTALLQLERDITIGEQVMSQFRFEPDPRIAAVDHYAFQLATTRSQVPQELVAEERRCRQAADFATTEVRRACLEYDVALRDFSRRKGLEADLAEARASLREAEVQLAELEDLRQLLKAWISGYFEDVLTDLSERTSLVLATVPNVDEWRIDFRTEIQTKRGTSRRGVFAVPQHRGEDRSLDGEDLSGGMKSAIHLAVDLGLANLVAERTGATLGWLLVDEAFDGLDPASRERCLEMVREFAQERGVLVLLVDHSCEVQEALSGVIAVESAGGGSQVRVITS